MAQSITNTTGAVFGRYSFMGGLIVAVLLVVGGSEQPSLSIADLVFRLGSSRFADRESASQQLSRVGRQALPALRHAATSSDAEVRTRASLLVRQIEDDLLVQPTMVSFNFVGAKIKDVLSTINTQTGLRLRLNPDDPTIWDQRVVTVQHRDPMPFWRAMDALCEAASLHYVFGAQADFNPEQSSFDLYDGLAPELAIHEDSGPFRIQLASLHYQSDLHFGPSSVGGDVRPEFLPPSPKKGLSAPMMPRKQFYAQLLIGAEPRLAVAPSGPIKMLEATDDQGRSLLLSHSVESIWHESDYFGITPSPLVHQRLDLNYPEKPAQRVKRLKGSVALQVSSRKPDPLELSLDKEVNPVVQRGNVSIRVVSLQRSRPDQPALIELSIRSSPVADHGDEDEHEEHARSIISPHQLEVLDATGRIIPWFPSNSFYDGEEAKLTLTLLEKEAALTPVQIRFHELIRVRTEVPFEFRDLPVP